MTVTDREVLLLKLDRPLQITIVCGHLNRLWSSLLECVLHSPLLQLKFLILEALSPRGVVTGKRLLDVLGLQRALGL